jgi:hypothetical protein
MHVHGDGRDALIFMFFQDLKQVFEARPTVPKGGPVNAPAIRIHQQRHKVTTLPV